MRPAVLTSEGKLSENVKYLITDRSRKNIVGVVINNEEKIIIEFFDKVSPIITFDKKGKKFDFDAEIFKGDPKAILNKLLTK
jgi:hypothetical protein